ncbi:hypothetical protein QYF61_004039 [Mycteria americana]|uniref:Uncharacterized protein n=1 Tax=Mycteria americana TaxID=33587 RepID=A0AAN7RVH8_MYCAM|nr:hypothetical protein QYF61_004039 [Mycteria americana]
MWNDCFALDVKLPISSMNSSFLGYFAQRKTPKILKDFLNNHLPANAHQLVSGRLHVVLTRFHDWRNVVVSEFASREDLIQRYVDGELSMWQAGITARTAISVSPFAGEYDICPKDGSAAFFNFTLFDYVLHISKRNIHRFLYIFHFPTDQVHNQFYTEGYQDTVSFLKKLSK